MVQQANDVTSKVFKVWDGFRLAREISFQPKKKKSCLNKLSLRRHTSKRFVFRFVFMSIHEKGYVEHQKQERGYVCSNRCILFK